MNRTSTAVVFIWGMITGMMLAICITVIVNSTILQHFRKAEAIAGAYVRQQPLVSGAPKAPATQPTKKQK